MSRRSLTGRGPVWGAGSESHLARTAGSDPSLLQFWGELDTERGGAFPTGGWGRRSNQGHLPGGAV